MNSFFPSGDDTFYIVEVGQNHQGDLDRARSLSESSPMKGRMQSSFKPVIINTCFPRKRMNHHTPVRMRSPILTAHREKLELKSEWLPILREDCHKNGVKFMSTPFDEPSLMVLDDLDVDLFKVASFDLGNLPFMAALQNRKASN